LTIAVGSQNFATSLSPFASVMVWLNFRLPLVCVQTRGWRITIAGYAVLISIARVPQIARREWPVLRPKDAVQRAATSCDPSGCRLRSVPAFHRFRGTWGWNLPFATLIVYAVVVNFAAIVVALPRFTSIALQICMAQISSVPGCKAG
jgi:hypothetical protein